MGDKDPTFGTKELSILPVDRPFSYVLYVCCFGEIKLAEVKNGKNAHSQGT